MSLFGKNAGQPVARTAAELDRWHQTIVLLEECDMQAGGEPSESTKTARAAYERARNGGRK
jgi:hypothetical protein